MHVGYVWGEAVKCTSSLHQSVWWGTSVGRDEGETKVLVVYGFLLPHLLQWWQVWGLFSSEGYCSSREWHVLLLYRRARQVYVYTSLPPPYHPPNHESWVISLYSLNTELRLFNARNSWKKETLLFSPSIIKNKIHIMFHEDWKLTCHKEGTVNLPQKHKLYFLAGLETASFYFFFFFLY